MRWHNPSPQSGLPWSSLGFHRTNLTTTQVVGPLLLRRPRIRFIGNGRLVRNAVGSRYYLISLSASYLTTKVIVPLSTTYRVLLPKPYIGVTSGSRTHTVISQGIFLPHYVTIAAKALWSGLYLHHRLSSLGARRLVSTHLFGNILSSIRICKSMTIRTK